MLTHAITAILLAASPSTQGMTPELRPREQIGSWDIRVMTDPLDDQVSILAIVGTERDRVTLLCRRSAPQTARLVWSSTTRFEGPIDRLVRRSEGQRIGLALYRFDGDAPSPETTMIRSELDSYFPFSIIAPFTQRLATSSRLILRDGLNPTHTAVFDLNPVDTAQMLQRLDAVCGTRFSAPPAEPADEDAEASPPAKGG